MKKTLKITWNLLLWSLLCYLSVGYETTIYLFHQSKGQIALLLNTQSIDEYVSQNTLNPEQTQNLQLIEQIKKYSVDSIGYKPTKNFSTIYNQGKNPLLWVITASSKFKIEPYYWTFPIVGNVSYKGFFDKQKALVAKNKLICLDYDVDLRSVSAWSTLGWFSDPILSNMLNKSKGNLCNLIFHELFHATYYAESSVDYNENLASFVAHKATLNFLRNDTIELNSYLENYNDNKVVDEHMISEVKKLNTFYDSISSFEIIQKNNLKLKKIAQIANSLNALPLSDKERVKRMQNNIVEYKNAWFVDFGQYNSLQDSLEGVFNKFYQANLRKMVQSLK